MAACARPGCGEPAVAFLAADFDACTGWLRDLDGSEVDPHHYLLCERHADRLTLPLRWQLTDERVRRLRSVPPAPAPAASAAAPSAAAPSDPPTPTADAPVESPAAPPDAQPTAAPVAAQASFDDAAPPPRSTTHPSGAVPSSAVPSSAVPSSAGDRGGENGSREYDPAAEVGESTPLLSRAFRAAAPRPRD